MKKITLLLLFVVLPVLVFSQEEIKQIDDKAITEKVRMYPNPNPGQMLNFKINLNLSHQVKIYDVLGKEVFTGFINKDNNEVFIGELKNGVYLVEIRIFYSSYTNTTTMKLIKI